MADAAPAMTPANGAERAEPFWRRQLRELPLLLIAWLLAWPLGRVFPRAADLILVIGRDAGRFTDNAKYFYIHGVAHEAAYRTFFLTGDRATYEALCRQGAPVVRHPALRSLWLLLRAGTVVADSAEWVRAARYQLASGARKVQLWHGVPLKMIERMVLRKRLERMAPALRLPYRLYTRLYARYPFYDLVLSTSALLTAAAFRDSFRARRILECGYPRNDVLRADAAATPLVRLNTDEDAMAHVQRHAAAGGRVILYAPTFRTHGDNPMNGRVLDYARLDGFARRHGLLFVLKLHPVLASGAALDRFECIIEYGATCDVYPLLATVDLLVTDYSSIFFDFLLLDRPIVFFTYDDASYRERERDLVFDFSDMTPGPCVADQEALEQAIGAVLQEGGDIHAPQRAAVRERVFGSHGGESAPVVWRALDELHRPEGAST